MNIEQIARENTRARRLGIVRTAPKTRDELLELLAGLLAHHSPVEQMHRSKANALLDGLNLHRLLTEYCT